MNQPTDEQVKKFWEWCGFRWWSIHPIEDYKGGEHQPALGPEILLPDDEGDMPHLEIEINGEYYPPPPIDLNNLFKYAVPLLGFLELATSQKIRNGFDVRVGKLNPKSDVSITHKDSTLALFWAIWEVIENERHLI